MDIASLVEVKTNPDIPAFDSGDTVRVSVRVVEGDKERVQVFQGVVIGIKKGGAASSFTVRRVTYGVGVERTFPFHSPRVEKVEVVRRGKTRRAKLFYLRGRSAKASRLKERRLTQKELEREREEAERLKREKELKREQEEAEKLAQETEPEAEEAPVMEQEAEAEAEAKEEPKLELEPEAEPEVEVEVEEAPVMEQEPMAEAEAEVEPETEAEKKED